MYNDGFTPSVNYSYDRHGWQIGVTNGSAVTLSAFSDAGQHLSETYFGGPLDTVSVTNGYDQLLRRTNLAVLRSNTQILQQYFTYDTASRLKTVSDGTNTAGYTFLANSALVSQILFTNNGSLRMTTSKQYDFLDRLTSIGSVNAQQSTLSSFSYSYNSANQRTSVTNEDGCFWVYGYDALGQVISGRKYWLDGTPVAGQQFDYTFDDIGNRVSTLAGGDQWGANLRYASYTANSLNQYTSRTVPGAIDIIGSATTTATVTVNNFPSYRKGDYYRVSLPVANTPGPVWQSVTNLAVLNNGTNSDYVASIIGNLFVSQTPETFTYDGDGNLSTDGRWQYTWDAENRLVSMQAIAGVPTPAKLKLDFHYDPQSRRTQKIVSTNNGAAYFPQSTNGFVYDRWNPIASLNSGLLPFSSMMWGLDLSGSTQGSGGVGGLWELNDINSEIQLAVLDGNGNLAALIRATDGSVSAQYEYGPFGEPIRTSGPVAKANPFGFSTKYQDYETKLVYYGYRHYNPGTGRWSNRDRIGERGGWNVFEYARNDPINLFDYMGMCGSCAATSVRIIPRGWATRDNSLEPQIGDFYHFSVEITYLPGQPATCCKLIQWIKATYTYITPQGVVNQILSTPAGVPYDGAEHVDTSSNYTGDGNGNPCSVFPMGDVYSHSWGGDDYVGIVTGGRDITGAGISFDFYAREEIHNACVPGCPLLAASETLYIGMHGTFPNIQRTPTQ
jgi:RHS repeat-associated protein